MIFSTKLVSALAAVLASSTVVHAQTHSECNPLLKDGCPMDPALGGESSTDFTKGADDSFFKVLAGTTLKYDKDMGATFSISNENEAPTIASNKYIFFGKLEVVLRAAPGAGIVTSIVLQSDDLDEIDWEWVGGDTNQVQTNYFSKGNTTTYDRGAYHPAANAMSEFHKYTLDWTAERIVWSVNDVPVRTLTYADAYDGLTYPQTPMQIKLGTWVAAKGGNQGTIDWAGGRPDFGQGPFLAYYKSIAVTDYSNGVQNAVKYEYTDRSGKFESIKVHTADGSTTTRSSATTTKTTTKTTNTATSSHTSMVTTTRSTSTSATTTQGPSSTSGPTTPENPETPTNGGDNGNPTTIPGAAPKTALTTVTMLVAAACVCIAQLLV